MQRSLSAPGKLFLSGEYAVLWGGAARVLAAGPRAGCFVRAREDKTINVFLREGRLSGSATPSGVLWEGAPPEPFRFVARTLDLCLRAHGRDCLGFEVGFAPSPEVKGKKLGMGGSARSCVLASEAGRFALGARFDPLKLALLAHADAQGGKGSGADVAAIYAGGLVRYRRFSAPGVSLQREGLGAELAESPPVDLFRVPLQNVQLGFAFTGKSASTQSLIGHVEARLSQKERESFVWASDDAGRALEEALAQDDFAAVRKAVAALEALLKQLGPLETEEARQVIALAASFGCAAKLSGAGGGDGCVLFAPHPEALRDVLAAIAARNFWTTVLTIEEGLRGESEIPEAVRGYF